MTGADLIKKLQAIARDKEVILFDGSYGFSKLEAVHVIDDKIILCDNDNIDALNRTLNMMDTVRRLEQKGDRHEC